MEIDLKTVNAAIVTGTPALIIATGAFFTAKLVTARLEQQKIDAAERMEVQKQKMELYKTIYIERIGASKMLMMIAGEYTSKVYDFYSYYQPSNFSEQKAPTFEELNQLSDDLYVSLTVNNWLFTDQVFNAGMEFYYAARPMFDHEHHEHGKSNVSDKFHKSRLSLSKSVSRMMHDYNVEEVVFPLPPDRATPVGDGPAIDNLTKPTI